MAKDENWYKATWAHRVWFASGCATLLICLSKSFFILISQNPSTSSARRTWSQLAVAAALGYLLADLASGVYHWAIDNYGTAQTPIFGPQIESFRAHHQRPSEITKCETAGIVYILAAVATAAVSPVNLFCGDPVVLAFVGAFAGFSMFSIKFHAWAHLPRRRLRPLAVALQGAGVLIRLSEHAPHHRPPYNSSYCTVSGVWNKVLDGSGVLAGAEASIFQLTGVRPRSWSEPISEWTPKTEMADEDDVTLPSIDSKAN